MAPSTQRGTYQRAWFSRPGDVWELPIGVRDRAARKLVFWFQQSKWARAWTSGGEARGGLRAFDEIAG